MLVVIACPLTKFEGDLQSLHKLEDDKPTAWWTQNLPN